MQIKIHKDNLVKSLSLVSSIVPAHPSLFVLTNMLIEADRKGTLCLSATDLDISMRIEQEALVENDGNAIIPARKMFDVVRELPQDMILISKNGDTLVMECGRGHFELQTFPGEDYPALPRVDFEAALKLEGEMLLRAIDKTIFAMSKDQARPILTGVLLEMASDYMGLVATDGHRLARFRKKGKFKEAGKGRDMIIPMKALNQIKKLYASSEKVEIAVVERQIGFRGEGKELYTRLLEGPFPNYELVIPQDNDKKAFINVKDMISASRRMQMLANPTTKRVTFDFSKGQLVLKVSTRDVGQANESLDIEYANEDIEVSFNAAYIEEALKAINSERVLMLMKKEDTACIVKPEEIHDDEENFSILMPLRIMEGEE